MTIVVDASVALRWSYRRVAKNSTFNSRNDPSLNASLQGLCIERGKVVAAPSMKVIARAFQRACRHIGVSVVGRQ